MQPITIIVIVSTINKGHTRDRPLSQTHRKHVTHLRSKAESVQKTLLVLLLLLLAAWPVTEGRTTFKPPLCACVPRECLHEKSKGKL